MAQLKPGEIREMGADERAEKLNALREELMTERGRAAMGGAPANPGRIRAIRRQIARLLTVMHETTAPSGQAKRVSATRVREV